MLKNVVFTPFILFLLLPSIILAKENNYAIKKNSGRAINDIVEAVYIHRDKEWLVVEKEEIEKIK
jgi:hypothetical protein